MPGIRRKGSHDLLKEINTRLIFNLIKQRSPISRIEISKETGLSKSTVSEIVDSLIQKDIVREGGSGDSIGGRRPILLYPNSRGRLSIGIQVDDYGELRGVLCDLESNIIAEKRDFCLEQEGLVDRICGLIDILAGGTGSNVMGVGLAVPGVIDYEAGSIVSAVNPGWVDVPLAAQLRTRYDIPIYIENATGAAALGENWFGAGADSDDMVYVWLGSVVGAAIIIDGALYHGSRGSAGELGHTVITGEKIKCRCGRYGCVESLISKPAVYRGLTQEKALSGAISRVSPSDVFKWLVDSERNGDTAERGFSKNLLREIATHLATAVANLVNLLGPQAIVIRSDLTESHYFMATLIDRVQSEILPRPGGKVEVRKSILGENAVIIGAAALVLQSAFSVSEANSGRLSVQSI
ncbi:MAG: ROK family transcriptional regulator [Firmicutes bacterium]|nr:ROK family transcriptional regulator [Bacillota bacterium]